MFKRRILCCWNLFLEDLSDVVGTHCRIANSLGNEAEHEMGNHVEWISSFAFGVVCWD